MKAQVKYSDWEQLVGKQLRVKIGDSFYEGKLLGLNKSVVSAISTSEVANPWMLETSDQHLCFYPETRGVSVEIISG